RLLRLLLYAPLIIFSLFFFPATPPTEIYTLSLHDALPISKGEFMRMSRLLEMGATGIMYPRCESAAEAAEVVKWCKFTTSAASRSEEHTSELQSRGHLVCRLLLEKKKKQKGTQKVPRAMTW